MLLSEMFGVERNTDFGVKGYEPLIFIINTTPKGMDRLYFKHNDGCWIFTKAEMLTDIIYGAPDNIIHLPPPLTDEQRDILKAYLTIGYMWMTKDDSWGVALWETEPSREYGNWSSVGNVIRPLKSRECTIRNLVSSSDPEPFDIGKALGVGE